MCTKQEGRCTSFDSSLQQYVSLPALDFTGLSQGFSFSFWFKNEVTNNANTNFARIFDFGNGAGSNNILFGQYGTSNDAFMQIFTSNGNPSTSISQGFLLNTWFHYIWVIQRQSATSTLSTWRVYQNSKLVAELANMQYPTAATRLNYIARNHWNQAWFKGKVDSFGIFQSPVQAGQVALLQGQAAILAVKGSAVSCNDLPCCHDTLVAMF